MMDIKEKLVELLHNATDLEELQWHDLYDMRLAAEEIAGYLISHGVMVQEQDGCEYCKGEFVGENPIVAFGDDSDIESIVEGEFLYNFCNCGAEHVVEINFCPMCGRKLTQPPEFDK